MKKLILLLSLLSSPAYGAVPCSLPFNLQNGQPADANQVMSNYNAIITCLGNAAAAGANSDITSLTGMTTPLTAAQGGTPTYIGGVSTNSANAQVVATTTPAGFALGSFQVLFQAGFTNTGAATLNVNSTGAIAIRKQTTTGIQPLIGNELITGQVYAVFYDGTFWQLLNPSSSLAIVPPSSITAAYTAVTTDCGKTLSLGGGAFYTVTIPAAAGFPIGCSITLFDLDGNRGKGIIFSGPGLVLRLFPNQTMVVTNQTGTAWFTAPQSQFWTSPGTFYVNHAIGSDSPANSDCLAPGAGACSTFQNAVNLIQNFTLPIISNGSGGSVIQADCGPSNPVIYDQTALGPSNSIQLYRGLGGIIFIVGSNGTLANALNCAIEPTISTTIIDVQDGQQMSLSGFTLGFTGGASGVEFNARQIVIADVDNTIFASATSSGAMVVATDLASVNIANVQVQGSANAFVSATNGAAVQINGVAIAAATTASPTIWVAASNAANVAGTPAWSVAGTVSGQKYNCAYNAVINLGSPYPAALTAGSATNGCQANPP